MLGIGLVILTLILTPSKKDRIVGTWAGGNTVWSLHLKAGMSEVTRMIRRQSSYIVCKAQCKTETHTLPVLKHEEPWAGTVA